MVSRRALLGGVVAASAAGRWSTLPGNPSPAPLLRSIPGSGELLPALGLGSWITFDVLELGGRRVVCREVMQAFFERGGRMIDSSPMYGAAQEVIGEALAELDNDEALFSASKVWIPGATTGRFQTGNSLSAWGLERFDLLQVHNMVDWQEHLPWMREWQALPPFAAEIGCANWAQFFLKFIVSHPAVSCAIPATSQVAHLHENMGALALPMPDAALRQEMVRYFERVSG